MTRARHPAFEAAAKVPATEVLRQRGLARVAGNRVIRGKGSPCPDCGKANGAFSSWRGGFALKCHSCGGGWDAVALVQLLDGLGPLDAARRVLGLSADGAQDPADWPRPSKPGVSVSSRPAKVEPRRSQRAPGADTDTYDTFRRAVMTLGLFSADPGRARLDAWFRARGLDPDFLPDARARLRDAGCMIYGRAGGAPPEDGFHMATLTLNGRTRDYLAAPAMLARIDVPGKREAGGLHATYLSACGRYKLWAGDGPARKMWASAGGARGGAWLTADERCRGPLFVGEGIETVLSALMEYRLRQGFTPGTLRGALLRLAAGERPDVLPGRALALLSLDNMQGGIARDRFGRMRIDPLEPDPERPAVTWPRMGTVVICADHDMKPVDVRCAGGPKRLSQTERMELSIRLATDAWRAAGAARVSALRPPPGLDLNDVRRRKAAGEYGSVQPGARAA